MYCCMKAKEIAVTDLTEKNWHFNSKSLASLVSKIQATSLSALSVLVLDLFGNTSVLFKQADDTLSLAVKLPGEGVGILRVTPCTPGRDSQGAGQISQQPGGPPEKWGKNLYSSHLQICFWFMLRQQHTRHQHLHPTPPAARSNVLLVSIFENAIFLSVFGS